MPELIGLADWFSYRHTDGRHTLLRQTSERLFMVIERPNARPEWRRYADKHGMILDIAANSATIEQAIIDCESC